METITLTNDYDFTAALAGRREGAQIRTVTIEALVDTSVTMLRLPADVVAALGLPERGRRRVRDGNGQIAELPWVGGVKIEIQGREAVVSALVGPEGSTPHIGQMALEEMDFVVDPESRALRPNPASPDAPGLDLLGAALANV
jgi:predicted aspartyl protease